MFILLTSRFEPAREAYIPNYASRPMFIQVEPDAFGADWAAFAKVGASDVATALAYNLIVAMNLCTNEVKADRDSICPPQVDQSLASGAHQVFGV